MDLFTKRILPRDLICQKSSEYFRNCIKLQIKEMRLLAANTEEPGWKWRFLSVLFLVGCCGTATGRVCRWVFTNNTLIYGGTASAAAMMPECKNACESMFSCQGIDWAPMNAVNERCFLHMTQNDKYVAAGVQHYDVANCTECAWKQLNNTFIPGGMDNPATSIATCQGACKSTEGCESIDWAIGNPPGQQCYLLRTQTGKTSAFGVTHYDIDCSAGPSCYWTLFPNTNIQNGVSSDAMTLTDCQMACQSMNTCMSFDWARNSPPGQQCYLHTRTNGKQNAADVDHYDILGNCRGGCTWTAFANSQIAGGMENNRSMSVDACQSACQSTAGCQGIDWANDNSPGQQCYLLQSQSGKIRAPGVTHYDLTC